MTDVLEGEDPCAAQWVIIDPLPAFAAVMGLAHERWWCGLMLVDGERRTAITTSEEAMDTLRNLNESGVMPPDEWAGWAGNQFETRPGWPVDWLHGDW